MPKVDLYGHRLDQKVESHHDKSSAGRPYPYVGCPKLQQCLAAHCHEKPIYPNDQRNTQPFWPQGFPIGVFPERKSCLHTDEFSQKANEQAGQKKDKKPGAIGSEYEQQ